MQDGSLVTTVQAKKSGPVQGPQACAAPRPARTPPLQPHSPRSRWRRLARAQELRPFDMGCQAGLLPSCADSNSAHA